MTPRRHRTGKKPFNGKTLRGAAEVMGKTVPVRTGQVDTPAHHRDNTGPSLHDNYSPDTDARCRSGGRRALRLTPEPVRIHR